MNLMIDTPSRYQIGQDLSTIAENTKIRALLFPRSSFLKDKMHNKINIIITQESNKHVYFLFSVLLNILNDIQIQKDIQ